MMATSHTFSMVTAQPDGESSFETVTASMTGGTVPSEAPAYTVSSEIPGGRMVFTNFPPGFSMEWHPAPRRQFILLIAGRLELTTSDGDRRTFTAGDAVLMADLDGRGHCSRSADGCSFASIAVTDDFEIVSLTG